MTHNWVILLPGMILSIFSRTVYCAVAIRNNLVSAILLHAELSVRNWFCKLHMPQLKVTKSLSIFFFWSSYRQKKLFIYIEPKIQQTNALSFYRSKNVLGWSKSFVPDQKFIYILWQSQTFGARQKDDLHSVKLFFVSAQKFLKRH